MDVTPAATRTPDAPGPQAPAAGLAGAWAAYHERGALWRHTPGGVLVIRGDDRARFMQAFVTNDVSSLECGGSTRVALINIKGRVLAFGTLTARDADWAWTLPYGDAHATARFLENYVIADDVELAPAEPGAYEMLLAAGPGAAAFVEALFGAVPVGAAAALASGGWAFVSDRMPQPAFELVLARGAPPLVEAAAAAGLVEAPLELAELLRIQAGYPRLHLDTGEDYLPQESRLDRYISYTKGCYLGQEVMARLDAQGHINKRLEAITAAGHVPTPGATLEVGGKAAGKITSVAALPGGGAIGLAYLRMGHDTPGTVLDAPSGPVIVAPWPGPS